MSLLCSVIVWKLTWIKEAKFDRQYIKIKWKYAGIYSGLLWALILNIAMYVAGN
jgi:hypothetical protein